MAAKPGVSGPTSPAGKPTSLDVYCRRNRRWKLEAQLPPDQMDKAVREAERLDALPGVEGVRIMMPTMGTSTRKPIELMVWVSPRLEKDMFRQGVALKRHSVAPEPPPPPKGTASEDDSASGSLTDAMVAPPTAEEIAIEKPPPPPPPPPPHAPAPTKQVAGRAAFKVVAVGTASLAIGFLATAGVALAVPYAKGLGIVLSAPAKSNLLWGTFIVGTLGSLVGLGFRYLSAEDFGAPSVHPVVTGDEEAEEVPYQNSGKASVLMTLEGRLAAGPTAESFTAQAVARPAESEEIPPIDMAMEPDLLEGPSPPIFSEAPVTPEAPPAAPLAIAPAAGPVPASLPPVDFAALPIPEAGPADPAPDAGPKKLKAKAKSHKVALVAFLQETIIAVKDRVRKLDAHTAFGLHLFLAGACEAYAEDAGLSDKERLEMMTLAVAALGAKPERIKAFLANLPAYNGDSKYRSMIKCGRFVMRGHRAKDASAFRELTAAMEAWTSGAAGEAMAQGVVTIMFTDIVGSTKMTRERGDFGAQEAVRAHNAVVRNALAHHGGREVKHTGDGIMATFPSAAAAVGAARMIQRDLARRNATPGQAPVHVRIGLNAGDVVREENDIYGAAVQLSARTCDKAGAGQIFVTASVRDLTKGHDIPYAEAGSFAMKGIDGDVALFAVGWEAV